MKQNNAQKNKIKKPQKRPGNHSTEKKKKGKKNYINGFFQEERRAKKENTPIRKRETEIWV